MNNTPQITQLNIHNVTPDDVQVVLTVFPYFGSIDIKIGKMAFQLFCTDTAEAHAIAQKLSTYTVVNSVQQESSNQVIHA